MARCRRRRAWGASRGRGRALGLGRARPMLRAPAQRRRPRHESAGGLGASPRHRARARRVRAARGSRARRACPVARARHVPARWAQLTATGQGIAEMAARCDSGSRFAPGADRACGEGREGDVGWGRSAPCIRPTRGNGRIGPNTKTVESKQSHQMNRGSRFLLFLRQI